MNQLILIVYQLEQLGIESKIIKQMIKEYDVESPICMLKGLEPSTTDGVETFPMILSDMEITRISGVLEYYDDYITAKIPESNLKVISIAVKCATNEFKAALYNSGVIGLIQYLNLLYYGDSFDMDNSFIMVNELYVLLEYAGELFDFGGNKKWKYGGFIRSQRTRRPFR